jgi:hypothetical protein
MGVGIGVDLLSRFRRWLTGDVDDDLAVASDLDLRNLKTCRLDRSDRATDFNRLELPITAAHGCVSTSNDLSEFAPRRMPARFPRLSKDFSSAFHKR